MSTLRSRAVVLGTLLMMAAGLTPAAAVAATPEEEAALLLFKEGRSLFDAKRYQQALDRFTKAQTLVKNEFLTFYMARTYAALKRCDEAVKKAALIKRALPDTAARSLSEDLAECRISLAEADMRAGKCAAAKDLLGKVDASTLRGSTRNSYRSLSNDAQQCAAAFDTSKAAGQEAARLYALAQARVAAKDDKAALKQLDASLKAQASVAASWLRVQVLDRLDRCGAVLKQLGKIGDKLGDDDAKAAEKIETRCLMQESTRLAGEKSCRKAMRWLTRLEGRLRGSKERTRLAQIEACAPYATEFVTDTPQRKAAYKLYIAAKAAIARGDTDRAQSLTTKAAAMVPDPVVLRLLADVEVDKANCDGAIAAIGRIATAKLSQRDKALRRSCKEFRPPADRTGSAYTTYVRNVTTGLLDMREGRYEKAAKALQQTAGTRDRALWVMSTDAWYLAGQCQPYLDATGAAPEGWNERLTDFTERRDECRTTLNISAPPVGPPTSPTVEPSGGDSILGWVLVGTGGALVVTAAVFGGLYASEASAMTDAAAVHNSVADATVAANAKRNYDDAASAAQLNSGLAWGLGAAGVTALGIGLWLALTDDGGTEGEGSTNVSIGPGPMFQGVSLNGSF